MCITDSKLGIGKDNSIPWHIPADLKYFKKITTEGDKTNIVIWEEKRESIPESYKPLSNRVNIVLSSQNLDVSRYENTYCFNSLNGAVNWSNNKYFEKNFGKIFIIGGGRVYEEAVKNLNINYVYQTKIR